MCRKLLITIFLLSILFPVTAQQLVNESTEGLTLHYNMPKVEISRVDSLYYSIAMKGYTAAGRVGHPALPMAGSLITIPFSDSIEVVVEHAVYDTLPLPEGRPVPIQLPRRKDDKQETSFVIDETIYATDAFYSVPLARVEVHGVGRDLRYASVIFSPVQVNPVKRQLVYCVSADITVRYIGADWERSRELYERYHTPAFSLGTPLNTPLMAKSGTLTAPVRMVVVAPTRLRCQALDDFVAWKRIQGMLVDVLYSNESASAIAMQLEAMFDNATTAEPAPTYVLLVGDVAQVQAFGTRIDDEFYDWLQLTDRHSTDLYYTTWTAGDVLPDAYLGRFSATDTLMLGAMIAKTLYYERYHFADDSYLGHALLVAGVDAGNWGDYAYDYADPTMDYAAYQYFNSTHGFNQVNYFKNNTSRIPPGVTVTGCSQDTSTALLMRHYLNQGIGWANYSAHGSWSGWHNPSFKVSHVEQMSNRGKPAFMIGNCCLSGKYDVPTCLGEALLRRGDTAGAIGYVGASNSTFWDCDLYWSVGVRSDVSNSMSLNYNANQMGMLDRLFHTHGEPLQQRITTAGQVVVAGNMSVEQSPSDTYGASTEMKQYYWEIYNLQGDPSLLPWLGPAGDINVALNNTRFELEVRTDAGAYVALISYDSLQLQSAAFAGSDGVARLALPEENLYNCFVSVTAQGYKPRIVPCDSTIMGIREVGETTIRLFPNPAADYCTVEATGLEQVTLNNLCGQTLLSVNGNGDRLILPTHTLSQGIYLLRVKTATGVSMHKLVK